MYCPSCRTKYRRGLHRCVGCGASLAQELPVEHSANADLVPIPGLNEADIGVVQSLLQARGLFFHVFEGFGEWSGYIGVRSSDLARVKACLKDFRTRGGGGSLAPIPW